MTMRNHRTAHRLGSQGTALVYVPTSRPCLRSIRAYAREARFLADCGDKVAFALVESNTAAHVKAHEEQVRTLGRELGIVTLHFDHDLQHQTLSAILNHATIAKDMRAALIGLLMPRRPDYSAGPNKASLLGAMLGANRLHRRDSDTMPQASIDGPRYPSELERLCVGRRIRELPVSVSGVEDLDPNTRIAGAGTNYRGAGAFDRSMFVGLSPTLMTEHERLENPDMSRDELEQRMLAKLDRSEETSVRQPDRFEVDVNGLAEMGAFAAGGLYRDVPECLSLIRLERTTSCEAAHTGLNAR